MNISVLNDIVAGRTPDPVVFTVHQLHRMLAAGIVAEGQPIELIDGVLMRKDRGAAGENPMVHGRRHAVTIARAQKLLERHVGQRDCHVRTQLPLTLSDISEPEPDLAVVAGDARDYLDHHPGADEAIAVIEVADSSLDYDRKTKCATYAAAGIRAYWIVNLVDDQVEVYSLPVLDERRYANQAVFKPGDCVALGDLPESPLSLPVDEMIPPRA
ncbi:MAG TPA: Uma2 family endonuclease [Pirellulales bacterium]|nr:Uma2 family endonuclease [Pirellulales bacterium]